MNISVCSHENDVKFGMIKFEYDKWHIKYQNNIMAKMKMKIKHIILLDLKCHWTILSEIGPELQCIMESEVVSQGMFH